MSQLGAIKIYRHSSKVTIYAFFFFEIVPAKLATLGRQLRFSEIRFFFFFFEEKAAKLRHTENSLERCKHSIVCSLLHVWLEN